MEEPGHRSRLLKAHEFVQEALDKLGTEIQKPTVADFGCGDGGLLYLLRNNRPQVDAWGYDLQSTNIRAAVLERGVRAEKVDFVAADPSDINWGDITVMTEVLEHLVDPHKFLTRVAERTCAIIASSPVNESDEHAYEFHTFAWDEEGFTALLKSAGFDVIRHEIVDGSQLVLGVVSPASRCWR